VREVARDVDVPPGEFRPDRPLLAAQHPDVLLDLAVTRPQQVVLAVPQALHVLDAAAIELVRLERGLPKGRHPTVDLGETAVIERRRDRKSTRLNSSHVKISYAVFCLKKKR